MIAPQPMAKTHPCFYAGAKGRFGRIHLPVAPSCNIVCAYCKRDMACIHESRPGVSNGVISPHKALLLLDRSLKKMPHISVAGIAGPGDAFCTPLLTLKTFELIREKHAKISLCVSSNGLGIKGHIHAMSELKVGFVTITMNTMDPEMGGHIYHKIQHNGKTLKGVDGAAVLIERQLEAIALLKKKHFIVKVNVVVIPGINEDHLLFLAKEMGHLGVDLMNFIPLIPIPGTAFEAMVPPSPLKLKKLRSLAGIFVPQMHHCNRCRSDAIGLLEL